MAGLSGLIVEQDEKRVSDLIKSAVKIERERCAKIAEKMPYGASFSDEFEAGYNDACKRIAAAIRADVTQ